MRTDQRGLILLGMREDELLVWTAHAPTERG
jgi:hypothetical protein